MKLGESGFQQIEMYLGIDFKSWVRGEDSDIFIDNFLQEKSLCRTTFDRAKYTEIF